MFFPVASSHKPKESVGMINFIPNSHNPNRKQLEYKSNYTLIIKIDYSFFCRLLGVAAALANGKQPVFDLSGPRLQWISHVW